MTYRSYHRLAHFLVGIFYLMLQKNCLRGGNMFTLIFYFNFFTVAFLWKHIYCEIFTESIIELLVKFCTFYVSANTQFKV